MRRWIWLSALVIAVAAGLALYALGRADARGDRDRRAGPPAAIEMEADPPRIRCDGRDHSGLSVVITDERGRDVRDGTEVYFAASDGFANPVSVKTRNGKASTKVRLYATAQFGEPYVLIQAGDLRATIDLQCKPANGGGGGCNPFSPPQHPMSPPCPAPTQTPCVKHVMSPPCVTATPTVTATPGGCGTHPMSPPCEPATETPTPEPPLVCDGGPVSPPCLTATPTPGGSPLYELGVFGQTQANNTVTVAAYILDLGGGPYAAAQWHVDYDESRVNLVSIEKVSPAPAGCTATNDNGSRVLLGCINPGGTLLDYFGDAYLLTFGCKVQGAVEFSVPIPTSFPSAVYASDGSHQPITTRGTTVGCGTDLSTPAPSPTPTPLFQLGFTTTASNNVVTTELYITDVGGGAYNPAQWHLQYPDSLLGLVSIVRAPGAPGDCDESQAFEGSLVAQCIEDPGVEFTYFGTTFIVTFNCLGAGSGQMALIDDSNGQTLVGANGVESVLIDQMTDSGPGWSCSGAAP